MYAAGHYGVSLLVYAPVGWLLAIRGDPLLAVFGGAVVLSLATVPDVDHRLPLVRHRGPTHSLLFAALVGAALGGAGFLLGRAVPGLASPLALATVLGGLGALGIVAHLAGDVLTPAGVNLLWPLPGPDVSLSLTRADNTLANWGLLALGVFVTAAVAVTALGGG
jgi:inner membrane protein